MTERERLIAILEAVLPYVEYAAAKGLPNALTYFAIISDELWPVQTENDEPSQW